MIRFLIVPGIMIFFFYSCRSTKKIQTAIAKKDTVVTVIVPNVKEDSLNFIRDKYVQLIKNKIDFITFSAKINIDYVDADDRNYNVNAFVRMYKDSVIWISVNAIFGIEALRAFITKDSVKLLDKQNKVASLRSVSYLQEISALPLNLSILQDLILGNPVFLDSSIVSYEKSPGSISLLSVGEWFKNLITINDLDKTLQHSKLDDIDITRNRTCDLTYTDYENKKGFSFSTKRKISVAEKKKLDIKMDFKQYEFNEQLTFPFSIPKNYKTQ